MKSYCLAVKAWARPRTPPAMVSISVLIAAGAAPSAWPIKAVTWATQAFGSFWNDPFSCVVPWTWLAYSHQLLVSSPEKLGSVVGAGADCLLPAPPQAVTTNKTEAKAILNFPMVHDQSSTGPAQARLGAIDPKPD